MRFMLPPDGQLWVVLIVLTTAVTAVFTPFSRSLAQDEPTVVTVKPVLSVDKVSQGSPFQVAVVATIATGYHVNAHIPSEKYLIPTDLRLTPLKGLAVEPALYPTPIQKAMEFVEGKKLALYEGKFVIGLIARAGKDLQVGRQTLKGMLRYQACNDQVCLPPDDIPVEIVFDVITPGQPSRPVNASLFAQPPFKK